LPWWRALDARLRGSDWALFGDELVNPLHQVREIPRDTDHAAPRVGAGAGHPPAQIGLQIERDERGLVAPVLEQLAASRPGGVRRKPVQHLPGIRAQPSENGQVVRPAEHVHRVELEQPELFDHPPHMPRVDPAGRPSLREPLGGERDPPRRHCRQALLDRRGGARRIGETGHVADSTADVGQESG
jgi:hypothetical protein